jgi:hypothetical protein
MYKKILYIGAGLHTQIINDFKLTKRFVLIDSRPRNEYGFEYYYRPYYRRGFVLDLSTCMKSIGFNIISKTALTNNYEEINMKHLDSTLLHFSTGVGRNLRSERNVNYYISTSCPASFYDNYTLLEDMKDCDTVVVSGHDPNSCFVNYINKPFHFVGYSETYFPKNLEEYKKEEENYNNHFIGYMLMHPQDIKSYTCVNYDTGEKTVCSSYEEFYDNLMKNK